MKTKRLLITQRGDNYSFGLPYMVTNLNDIICTTKNVIYSHKDQLNNYLDPCFEITSEINVFGNYKIIQITNLYKTYMFKTLKQANEFINNFKG